ncbi:hypothetical protein FA95DRAFT_63240 [Auriscalpium vulgare]|uniref:Uncharacterized protein n=1 Tax=Auriscalpium vulgare TaxID=40419 RepID=A0ACB8S8S1_9AGAM|nr:hypothetical protein FA95DRAFT_63240 [Auriscalpium vulgare]
MPLKQSSNKRRCLSLSSTPSPSNFIDTTPQKVAKISCVACHRMLKSNLLLSCERCSALTCAICSRTCISSSAAPASPLQTMHSTLPLGPTDTNRRRKAADLEPEHVLKIKDAEAFTGCARVVCRACCHEDLEKESTTCIDCLARTTHAALPLTPTQHLAALSGPII